MTLTGGIQGHGVDTGRHISHGLRGFLPGRGPGPSRPASAASGWMSTRSRSPSPPLRPGDRLRDRRRARPGTGPVPGSGAPACSCPARWSSIRRRARWICRPAATGGRGSPAPSGGTRKARAARSGGGTVTRSSRWPGRMRWPTRPGPASVSPPRPNGNGPPVAAWTGATTSGATSSARAGSGWPTTGRDVSPREPAGRTARDRSGRPFPPNGYGLVGYRRQRLGVVSDLFTPPPPHPGQPDPVPGAAHRAAAGRAIPAGGRPGPGAAATPPPGGPIPRRVVKGGSYLCAPDYCLRYRPGPHARARLSRRRRSTSVSAA